MPKQRKIVVRWEQRTTEAGEGHRTLRELRGVGGVQSLKAGLAVVSSWAAMATSFARKR
ncbi:hypothetical protein [Hoyosella altamirensis]|uniref:Uncharacterized protein n=1 Tax=Hoyosella altamirensis TaxID=616997 RepID=A0A839RNT3_9ACTN|nr:hypothetical protein [Hoyosella altamirensis]MBB3038652.1 hypothetical protein [Hoyosella altamirensis]